MRRKAIRKLKNSSRRLKTRNKSFRKTITKGKDSAWNNSMSLRENFENNLLVQDADAFMKKILKAPEKPKQIEVEEEIDLEQLAILREEVPPPLLEIPKVETVKKPSKLTSDEAGVAKRLMLKYGEDYEKMQRDIKTNMFQWNANQCRRKCEAYIEIHGNP
eukprot:TRINITY_DN1306_c0_g1_i1.p1 TRINITY_DN1306_c0_g1~~TRINITY_DN1306_c0_g1_i1.p1  ORF type:complete len:161 (-),score=49.28 TRINITY_DN1306_c0_g1_i1:115-597(-)